MAASGPPVILEPGRRPAPPFGQGLADKVPLILFSYDVENRRLLHCNRHCHSVLGYSSQELLEMGSAMGTRIFPPDYATKLSHLNLQALGDEDQALSWDSRVRHRNGSWRWLRFRLRAGALGPNGQVRELMGSAEDVTRLRTTVDELRRNRYLLRRVVDLVPSLIYIYDLEKQQTIYTNHRFELVLGYTTERISSFARGAFLAHIVLDNDLAQLHAHLAHVARLPEGEIGHTELCVRHQDGSVRWLRCLHAPFARSSSGVATSIIGVAEDITERRHNDAQNQAATTRLAEQHRLFRQVIDALPHPVYLKDGHGNYLLANQAMASLFGLSPEELEQYGSANVPVSVTGDIDRYIQQDQQVLATGQDLVLEEYFTYPNGQVEWFSSVKRLFERADGTAHVLGVDSIITELKLTQQALEAAIGDAEVDAQAKVDFLANMSHEIRTPLHGILGLTGVLAKTPLSRSQHDYLRLLAESADHLLTVLNDVLTTARLGAGKLQAEITPFSPNELLMGCAALLRPRAREKGLRLRVEKPSELPNVLGDAHRLRQVLLNLVSNAIKFTESGQVRLCCQQVAGPLHHSQPEGTLWLQFSVSDTGVGIPIEAQSKIFEPFAQAAASTDREYGGSGLGLSISEGLVKLLGGTLRVSSEVNAGSTFAFTLAMQPHVAEVAAAPPDTATAAAGLTAPPNGRVLLVEDNLVNSLLAETVLRNWGWQVTTAASGLAAIQLFEHRPFDLVLMDIQMPGMDGETAARALRAHPDPVRAATPVIALTARAQAGESERLQAEGFAGYLAKPYREEQLLETMRAVLARHQAAEPTLPLTSPDAMSSANQLYDLTNVRQLVRNDEAIVRRLAWAFIETTPAILTALDEALTKHDWEAVGDAAHHLKSSLDGLSVESLRTVIREVEAYGDTQPEPAAAGQKVALIRAVTEQVMAALRIEFPEQA